jgi:hypothetical protein
MAEIEINMPKRQMPRASSKRALVTASLLAAGVLFGASSRQQTRNPKSFCVLSQMFFQSFVPIVLFATVTASYRKGWT